MPSRLTEAPMSRQASGQPVSQRMENWGIVIILALFLVLGVIYSVATPLFEASDELWHYPFVKRLADGQGLPVQRTEELGLWRQEGSQPPLYYALGALVTFWVHTDDLPIVRWVNPHADMGVPTTDGNINMVIHTAAESFPYHGTALAVHIVRWMSVLLGAVAVYAGYRLAREIWPDGRLALLAAALLAFNPMFLFITASVNNDALVAPLCAVALWLMVRYVARRPTWAQWGVLGCVLGLASLAKASALGLLPLAALTGCIVAWRQRSWRELLKAGVLIALPVAASGGWWYYRNWQLYRDPVGLNAFVAIVGARYPVPTLGQLFGEWKGFVMSFWGFFGGLNLPAPEWLLWVLSLLGLVGLLAAPLYVWRAARSGLWTIGRRLQMGLILLWPLVVFVALIRWTLMTIASQGRLMFSALSALCLLMAMGWCALAGRRGRSWVPLIVAGSVLTAAVWLPFGVIRPAYAQPAILSAGDLDVVSHPLNIDFGGRIRLLGYDLDCEQLAPGDTLDLTLYWQALQPMDENYSVFVHLLGENDLIIAQRDRYPGQGNYPTSLWSPGEIMADRYAVQLPATARTPDQARVVVGWYLLGSDTRLEAVGADGQSLGDHVLLAELAIPARERDGIPNPVTINLGGQVALIGYSLDRTAARPGESVHLTLYWQALTDVHRNYSVFTHVSDDSQQIWAQKDGWPLEGAAPTATWRKGQVIEDTYELSLSPKAPPGVCQIEVGMYDADVKRLNVLGPGGYVQDTRIVLGKLRVLPGDSTAP